MARLSHGGPGSETDQIGEHDSGVGVELGIGFATCNILPVGQMLGIKFLAIALVFASIGSFLGFRNHLLSNLVRKEASDNGLARKGGHDCFVLSTRDDKIIHHKEGKDSKKREGNHGCVEDGLCGFVAIFQWGAWIKVQIMSTDAFESFFVHFNIVFDMFVQVVLGFMKIFISQEAGLVGGHFKGQGLVTIVL